MNGGYGARPWPEKQHRSPDPKEGHDRSRVLFLSGSIGRGHDALAEATGTVLSDRGVEVATADCMRLMGRRSGLLGEWAFRRFITSSLYDSFHQRQLVGPGIIGPLADSVAASRMRAALRAEAERFRPDVIVAVFATGVAGACHLKQEGLCHKVGVFLPDAMAHRMWVREDVDLFLATSPLGAASIHRYWPEAPVVTVDAPIDARFHAAPRRADARRALGLHPDSSCVLLMGGGWGIGQLDRIAESLASDGHQVIAVAGNNPRMFDRLRKSAQRVPGITAIGFSREVPLLMSACDVVVTTSGATCREARAMGRGLILLDLIPGHGRENLIHQLASTDAAVVSLNPEIIRRGVNAFLAHRSTARYPDQRLTPSLRPLLNAFRALGVAITDRPTPAQPPQTSLPLLASAAP